MPIEGGISKRLVSDDQNLERFFECLSMNALKANAYRLCRKQNG